MKNNKRIKELKAQIKNAEEMAKRYPEDANLQEACQWRIEKNLAELALLK